MMNPSKTSRICYPKCIICKKVRSPGSNVFLSRLPLDPLRCRHWVKAIGQIDLVYIPIEKLHELKYVCNLHFKPEQFNKSKTRLLKHAVPSENLTCPCIADELLKEFPLHVGQDSRLHFKRRIEHINLPSTSTLSLPSTSVVNTELDALVQDHLPSTSTLSLPNTSAVLSKTVPLGDITNTFGLKGKLSNEEDERTQQELVDVRSYKRFKKSNERKDSSQLTAKEEKLIKKLKETKLTLKKLTATKLDLEKLDGTILKTLVDDAISNFKKKPHGNRWNIATKKWALSVFKRSPRTYRFIQAAVPMPSTKTLNRMLSEIDMEPGLNRAILINLAEKTKDFKERDRCFTLMFDEIALKKRLVYNEGSDKIEGFVDFGSDLEENNRTNKIAGHALVFMIQGIGKKIKQPLAYYFVEATVPSDKLSILIKKNIVALREINIFILATVCDQGPTNVGAINLLKRFSGQPLESSHF